MRRQAELLRVNRSGLYYESAPADEEELSVMRRLDELHLVYPFYGSRKLALELRNEGVLINRKRVQRLMRLMGIVAMVPKPNTSKPAPENKTYPYLLRNLAILWPNQVWAADITYIPMARGFGYLVAIIDWFSRRVLAWRLSNSLDTRFCVDALEEALERFGQPDIFNTDQGAQFTCRRLHEAPARQRRQGQHGRERPLHRQHLRRAAVAFAQVRGDLFELLRRPWPGEDGHREIHDLLQ